MELTTYDSSGHFRRTLSIPDGEDVRPHLMSGEQAVKGRFSFTTHFWDGQSAVLRSSLPIEVTKTTIVADGEDEVALSGFPAGCEVLIDGVMHIVDGELSLSSDMTATYQLECCHWPYLDWSLVIEAV